MTISNTIYFTIARKSRGEGHTMTESETRFYTEAQANDLLGKKVITRVTLYQKCPAGTSGIIRHYQGL
jgi:hypothetical protein